MKLCSQSARCSGEVIKFTILAKVSCLIITCTQFDVQESKRSPPPPPCNFTLNVQFTQRPSCISWLCIRFADVQKYRRFLKIAYFFLKVLDTSLSHQGPQNLKILFPLWCPTPQMLMPNLVKIGKVIFEKWKRHDKRGKKRSKYTCIII